jgi:hypothetical protein
MGKIKKLRSGERFTACKECSVLWKTIDKLEVVSFITTA